MRPSHPRVDSNDLLVIGRGLHGVVYAIVRQEWVLRFLPRWKLESHDMMLHRLGDIVSELVVRGCYESRVN